MVSEKGDKRCSIVCMRCNPLYHRFDTLGSILSVCTDRACRNETFDKITSIGLSRYFRFDILALTRSLLYARFDTLNSMSSLRYAPFDRLWLYWSDDIEAMVPKRYYYGIQVIVSKEWYRNEGDGAMLFKYLRLGTEAMLSKRYYLSDSMKWCYQNDSIASVTNKCTEVSVLKRSYRSEFIEASVSKWTYRSELIEASV